MKRIMIDQLFVTIDTKDTNAFAGFLADDCIFRFANQAPVTGKQQVADYVAGFFDSIKSLSHELIDVWELDSEIICHGWVSYTRHSGSIVKVPFANVFKLDNGKICEYLIFADTSELYTE